MPTLGWVIAAGLLVAIGFLAFAQIRSRRRVVSVLAEQRRLEAEQTRMLQGLILSQEAASRILMPGELAGTIEKIAREAVDVLGIEGVCILVRPPEGEDDPTGLCWGRVPEGMGDVTRPVESGSVRGFGSILSIPIRLGDRLLGEFRLAESPGKSLSLREVQIARLLAQLVAITAQYRIQQRMIEIAEEDKSRFILATTHDLRAPVATIEQLTQVMREGYAGDLGGKPRELVDKIHDQATHMLDLLSDLLTLAAEGQEPGKMREMVEVSLTGIFDAQIATIRPACETKSITLTFHRPEGAIKRTAAKGDLEKVMSNLLSNAVKYTPPGGRIDARLEDSPGGVVFRVKDTGIGIPRDALARLFKEYFRAPNAKSMERHGTGLGLALVQKIVRKYGGRIRVDSVVDKGSLFEVLLPPE